MVRPPADCNPFEFVVLSGLRAAQLMRGCTPRLDGAHKTTMMAQMEVAAGKVVRSAPAGPAPASPALPLVLS
jgi:DNA-directed RNA polymerase subunit K/omega